jgi:ferredoxin
MANKAAKIPESVPGKYYVDTECVFCRSCIDLASENFDSHDDEYAYVKKQPENDAEEEACKEAMASCPFDSIGNDGEE